MTQSDNERVNQAAQPRANMILEVEIQTVTESAGLPTEEDFILWVRTALLQASGPVELVIRIVDEEESQQLNRDYRGMDRPTNVLSFSFEAPPEVASPLLGDMVVCAPVVVREAREQGKAELAHWAHMVVHGVLHLQGYDHQTDTEAEQMEGMEKEILRKLHFPDPYQASN